MFQAISIFMFFGLVFEMPPLLALFFAVCVYINVKQKKKCINNCNHNKNCNMNGGF